MVHPTVNLQNVENIASDLKQQTEQLQEKKQQDATQDLTAGIDPAYLTLLEMARNRSKEDFHTSHNLQ